MSHRSSRRSFLRNASLAGIAAAAAPVASSLLTPSTASAVTAPVTITDADIFNFALNLEYLEAEYYAKAYYGVGLVNLGIIPASAGATVTYPVTNRVNFFNPFIYNYAAEIANDEIAHVSFLRKVLGSAAVNEPTIDLQNSFNTLAQLTGLGNTFDPFESEENFLLGAFVFEDVGVTAYHGAAPLISSKDFIPPASGILAVEAYHASLVRTTLYNLNFNDPTAKLAKAVNLISATPRLARRPARPGSGHHQPGRQPEHRAHRRQRHRVRADDPAGAEHRLRRRQRDQGRVLPERRERHHQIVARLAARNSFRTVLASFMVNGKLSGAPVRRRGWHRVSWNA